MLESTLLYMQALQGNATSLNLRAVQNLAASCSLASETYQDLSKRSASDCSVWPLQLSPPLLIHIVKANQKLDLNLQESGRAAHS